MSTTAPKVLEGLSIASLDGLAFLISLDTGQFVSFKCLSESGEHREFGALWDEVGVVAASPQPSEYRYTRPERRTIRFTFNGYGDPGGLSNSVERDCQTLRDFTRRIAAGLRAHRLEYHYLDQKFGPCFLESCTLPVWRFNTAGDALIVKEGELVLKELPG
jgi:hypothetical protein